MQKKELFRMLACWHATLLACWIASMLACWMMPARSYADITGASLWYKLDETSGLTADDSSGNGRTGNLGIAGDWRSGTTCKVIGCLGWSAAAGNLAIATGASLATLGGASAASAITMAAWFQATGTPRDAAEVYNLSPIIVDGGFFMGLFWGKISGGAESLWVYNWDGNEDRVGAPYTQGQWVHLGLVHVSNTIRLYINGAFISATASGNTTDTSGLVGIGHAFLSGQCGTLCLIDEVRIFPTAKTDADMAELASYGLPARRAQRFLFLE